MSARNESEHRENLAVLAHLERLDRLEKGSSGNTQLSTYTAIDSLIPAAALVCYLAVLAIAYFI